MTAIPKPPKTKKGGVAGPQLAESDYMEIGEALDFQNEVEITTFHRKQFESARGVVTSAEGQTGTLNLRSN